MGIGIFLVSLTNLRLFETQQRWRESWGEYHVCDLTLVFVFLSLGPAGERGLQLASPTMPPRPASSGSLPSGHLDCLSLLAQEPRLWGLARALPVWFLFLNLQNGSCPKCLMCFLSIQVFYKLSDPFYDVGQLLGFPIFFIPILYFFGSLGLFMCLIKCFVKFNMINQSISGVLSGIKYQCFPLCALAHLSVHYCTYICMWKHEDFSHCI